MPGSRPKLPLGLRWLNAAGASLRAAHLPLARLNEETVHGAAVEETGLTDFGASHYREGLLRLIDSVEVDAGLHFLGRLGYRDLIVNGLVNRLLLTEAHKRTPEVFERPLVAPIMVFGLPRSGTTFLHRLLALDPVHRGLPQWELVHPLPDVGTGDRQDRRRIFDKKLKYGQRILPNMDHKHYSRTDTPEECMWLLAVTFLSPVYWVFAPVYGYLEWYMKQDRLQSYREYRSLLQVLQAVDPARRLVLKAPAHTGALGALLRTIPNALLVQAHRDPVEAINSLNSLFCSLHGGMTDKLDVRRMARANLDHQVNEIELNLAARDADPAPVVFDVYYERLVADPIGTVRSIYDHYELAWSEGFERRLISYVRENPKGKYGIHRYAAKDFGQTDEEIAERFATYSERFGFSDPGMPLH